MKIAPGPSATLPSDIAPFVIPALTRTETMGIIIRDRDPSLHTAYPTPRVDAFVYGEMEPTPPTLPFGRWKRHG
jgi:hypothetical protein